MSADIQLCPYCGVRLQTSDDHIFPDFLGGKTTIRACKPCNDLFGHAFEGPVSNDFAPAVVMLRRGGLRSLRRVVWKRAIQKEGIDYDLDSDLQLTPTNPSIERDEKGSIKLAIASANHMGFGDQLIDNETREFLLGSAEKSSRVRIDFTRHEELEKIRPPLSHFAFVKGNGN